MPSLGVEKNCFTPAEKMKGQIMITRSTRRIVTCGLMIGAVLAITGCASTQSTTTPCDSLRQFSVKSQSYSLDGDALFAFDRSGLDSIQDGGKARIADLADKIKSKYGDDLHNITVYGYTDRLGSDSYNQALSERRASTVKAYLRRLGVNVPIQAIGKGESDPIVTDCRGNDSSDAALVACLQPNRRVVLEVNGQKRVTTHGHRDDCSGDAAIRKQLKKIPD